MHTTELVQDFHRTFGHPVATHPDAASPATRLLRFKLIFEELMEYGRAIGMANLSEGSDEEFEAEVRETMNGFSIDPEFEPDLVAVADALTDLDYVVAGSALVHGIPAEACVMEVHTSNMSKAGADGKPIKDPETGKILKGPNFRLPNLGPIIKLAKEHGTANVGWNNITG